MEFQDIMTMVVNTGVFGALFIWLFYKTMNEGKEREAKLLAALDKFASCFNSLSNDVAEIKEDVEELKGK